MRRQDLLGDRQSQSRTLCAPLFGSEVPLPDAGQLFFWDAHPKVPDLDPDGLPFFPKHHLHGPFFSRVAKGVVNEIVEDPGKLLATAPNRQSRLDLALQAVSLLPAQGKEP